MSRNDTHARGEKLKAFLLSEEGGCVPAFALGAMFSLDQGAVAAYEASEAIVSVVDQGQTLYPCWQFSENKPYPIIAQLLSSYRPDNPYSVVSFFLCDHEALSPSVRPLDLMRAHKDETLCWNVCVIHALQ